MAGEKKGDVCAGSVSGIHGDADRRGICPWCGRKVMPALPKPALRPHLTEMDEAYGYVWDPDYGSELRWP